MRSDRFGWLDGLVIGTGETTILVDPSQTRKAPLSAKVLVSHAHADHTRGFKHRGMKQSTVETRDIHVALNDYKVTNFEPLEYRQRNAWDDMEAVALNAGHMLGSAQFLINTPNQTILYTGDINCVDTLVTKAATPEKCDVLVIEATYGSPFYKFPPREMVYAGIVEWALDVLKRGTMPCLHVYAAGKGQEIIQLFNVYTNLPVVVNPLLDGVNHRYKRSGHDLKWASADTKRGREILEKDACVYVTTPNDRHHPGRRHERAFATGWALSSKGRNTAFPLSSHADFDQLVRFIKECEPRRVYIFTGFAEELRVALRSRVGVEARVVPSYLQRTLVDNY
jgi:putative mRNA 3-end processing factor